MRRRDFIALVGGAAAAPALLCPLAARAQQAERMRRIGVLVSGAEADPEMRARLAGFREGLQRLGWSEGRNIRVDQRFAAASAEQARVFATELVATQCDVLVALSTAMAAALQRETRTMPIVFVGLPDPIGSGFVASLARPGGNATGLLLYEEGVAGKWLAMLKEIAPRLARVAILGNPKTNTPYYLRAAQALAPPLGIELVPSDVETAADIERAIDSFAQVADGGLLVPPDLTAVLHRDLIIALAARHRLPAVYQARFWVAAGGLMSYGTDRTAAFRQSAYYVDRILRGARPTDLPVQAPTKFETVINLATAKALGLTLPPAMLVAADEVIE